MMLAILIYSLNGVLKYYLPAPITNALMFLSALTFIWTVLRNISGFHLKGFTGLSYVVLILWSLCLTFHMFFIADIRSTFVEYHGLTTWLLAYFGSPCFLPNMLPLFLLAIPRNYRFDYQYLWRVMWLLCILYICYFPFAFWNMTHYQWSFDAGPGAEWGDKGTYGDFITNSTIGIASIAPVVIMIYFKRYLSKKHWQWYLITYIGSMLMAAYLARRGSLAMSGLYLAFAWLMYAMFDKKTSKIKLIFISILVIALGYGFFTGSVDSFFATLSERGDEDTREGVELAFFADMQDINDWIFGRGWFGQYYDFVFGYKRFGVETGYLTIILRGGIIYLIPYILLLVLSFINGFFRSKNLFCKSFAIICLMKIISLYPFGWPAFDFLHFVIFLGIWICNSEDIRSLTDDNIKSLLFNMKPIRH